MGIEYASLGKEDRELEASGATLTAPSYGLSWLFLNKIWQRINPLRAACETRRVRRNCMSNEYILRLIEMSLRSQFFVSLYGDPDSSLIVN